MGTELAHAAGVMKWRFKTWLCVPAAALAATLALVACGKGGGSDQSPDQAAQDGSSGAVMTVGLSQAQKLIAQTQARCPDGEPCPEGVGALSVITTDTRIDLCAAFLIAPDLAVTAASCIPPRVRSGELSCWQRVVVAFPPVGNLAASHAGCVQVSSAAQVGADAGPRMRDYAFIRLDHAVGRTPVPLSDRGLKDGLDLKVPQVSSISTTVPFGEIRVEHCKAVQRSMVFPEFAGDDDPVGLLGDCTVISTGRGAPAIDESGSARAIVTARVPDETRLQAGYRDYLADLDSVNDMAYATNLACVRTPLEAAPRTLPRDCDEAVPSGSEGILPAPRMISPDADSAQGDLDQRLSAWAASNSDRFKWKESIADGTTTRLMTPVPACINQPERWLDQYHHWYLFFSGGYESDTSISVSLPSWTLRFELNPYFQVFHSIQEEPLANAVLEFKPRDIHRDGRSDVTLKIPASGTSPERVVFHGILQKCQ